MEGPTIVDALWRTWVPDKKFLDNKNFAMSVHKTTVVRYAERGLATTDNAPSDVYGSCRRLKIYVGPVVDFNVSWKLVVDPDFQYFLRFYFLRYYKYIYVRTAFQCGFGFMRSSSNLDLTYLSNGELDTPIYLDFVTPIVVDNKIYVSTEPTINDENQVDSILNGELEMIKMSDIHTFSRATSPPPLQSISKNKTHPPSLQPSSKNKTGVIVGTIIEVIVFWPLCLFSTKGEALALVRSI
ncbi:hypothetical protein SOVF_089730 [Spinacia oleracea]|nr:hypothetical protein SOVF_089730 [Spinacia oleracea]